MSKPTQQSGTIWASDIRT